MCASVLSLTGKLFSEKNMEPYLAAQEQAQKECRYYI